MIQLSILDAVVADIQWILSVFMCFMLSQISFNIFVILKVDFLDVSMESTRFYEDEILPGDEDKRLSLQLISYTF